MKLAFKIVPIPDNDDRSRQLFDAMKLASQRARGVLLKPWLHPGSLRNCMACRLRQDPKLSKTHSVSLVKQDDGFVFVALVKRGAGR